MNVRLKRILFVASFPVLALLLAACGAPALVFLNPHYASAKVERVALMDFQDFPGMSGSGQMTAGIFEKYLVGEGYSLVDDAQVASAMQQLSIGPDDNLDLDTLRALAAKLKVDAFVLGQVTDFTDASSQTVVEDMTLEQDTPIYGRVDTVQRIPGGGMVSTSQRVQTGTDVSTVDQPVEQTETVDAHVGLSLRMVDASSGEVLWSASDSASGPHLNDAMERASAEIAAALQARIKALHS
ncbi:MAG: hypothetical protein ACREKE_06775 [bacterium]